jgi:poly [ADP-ribose] polymerase
LRIAPPEAPKSGYLFDKGVYLASMAEKSSGYCCASMSNNVGLFLLCEAAIGNPKVYSNFNCDASNLPKDCHSTHGMGTRIPDPA